MPPVRYIRPHHPWTQRSRLLTSPYLYDHQSLMNQQQKSQNLIMKLCISLWSCHQRKLRRSVCHGPLAYRPQHCHGGLRQRVVLRLLSPHPRSLMYQNVHTRSLTCFHGRVDVTCRSRPFWNLNPPATLLVHFRGHLYHPPGAMPMLPPHPFT